MARIVYVVLSGDTGIAGGQKMAIRHVEALNELGFEAVCYLGVASVGPRNAPDWSGIAVN